MFTAFLRGSHGWGRVRISSWGKNSEPPTFLLAFLVESPHNHHSSAGSHLSAIGDQLQLETRGGKVPWKARPMPQREVFFNYDTWWDGHESTGNYFWKMLVVALQQKIERQGTHKCAATDATENQEVGIFLKYKPFIGWKNAFFLPTAHFKTVFSGELLFRELQRWVPWEKHYFRICDKESVGELQLRL